MFCKKCGHQNEGSAGFCQKCGEGLHGEVSELTVKKQKKARKNILISGILGTLYLLYLISYFVGGTASSDGAEAVGGAIATAIVMPHMIFVFLSVVFTWICYGVKARWAALTAGILYSVSILMMPIYFMFVIIQLVLSFVAFSRMKN